MKYKLENGELLKGSLILLTEKYDSYRVSLDYETLVEGLDYSIDGSRLWVEKNLYGSYLVIEDGSAQDNVAPLLERIAALEEKINTLEPNVSGLDDFKVMAELAYNECTTFQEALETLDEASANIRASIKTNGTDIGLLNAKYNTLSSTIKEQDKNTKEIIYSMSEVFSKRYNDLSDNISHQNERIENLFTEYDKVINALAGVLKEVVMLKENVHGSVIDDKALKEYTEEVRKLNNKVLLLNTSIGVETAQRRRIDTEIKILLARLIADVEKIEAIIIGNYDDETAVYEFLEKIKTELNLKIKKLARINLASMTREFKLKQAIGKQENRLIDKINNVARITVANITRLFKLRKKVETLEINTNKESE